MDILDRYNIPWKGLSNGSHRFDFDMGDAFFKAFGDSVVSGGQLHAEVDANKSASMLVLNVSIHGEVNTQCDRCLGDLSFPVDYEGVLTVRFSDETDEYDGDVMWLSPSQSEVPLAQYLYESIILSLPYQRVHGTDENGNSMCDRDMLARFRIVSEDEFEEIAAQKQAMEQSLAVSELQRLKEKLEKEK